MMDILLNGMPLALEGIKTIEDLLKAKGYNGKLVAVAMNGSFLPKENYQKTELKARDSIEIVAPMQGG
jgi:sulfur carrier protein